MKARIWCWATSSVEMRNRKTQLISTMNHRKHLVSLLTLQKRQCQNYSLTGTNNTFLTNSLKTHLTVTTLHTPLLVYSSGNWNFPTPLTLTTHVLATSSANLTTLNPPSATIGTLPSIYSQPTSLSTSSLTFLDSKATATLATLNYLKCKC